MDVDGGVEGGELALVQVEVRGGEVAEIEGASAVACELVCGGAANADGRVCACDDDDFVFYASGWECQKLGNLERRSLCSRILTGSLDLQRLSGRPAFLRSLPIQELVLRALCSRLLVLLLVRRLAS